ncbi:hypothetical protein NL676_034684 [Syzygium grande]|nr:hypothetical protein NL676_034684 [Syzygium grande]
MDRGFSLMKLSNKLMLLKSRTWEFNPTLWQSESKGSMKLGMHISNKNKPPTPVELIPQSWLSPAASQSKSTKPSRSIPKTCQRMLEGPYILDDYYLNLLDWGANNMVAIALSESMYSWNASNGSATELVTFNDEEGPIMSMSWAPDGQNIAIGLQNSHVQLWDFSAQRQVRTFRGGHRLRVGSLAWNTHILTTGGMYCKITYNDVRIKSHIVGTYRVHRQEVCGLKWSPSGKQLASGGRDNLLYLTQWLHRIEDHMAVVKSLAWCPFQSNLLASGGSDRSIKFWNTCTGACLNSVDTGSRVCAQLWSMREGELPSSHGLTKNQLILWMYPSMGRMAELTGHTSRVLFLAQADDLMGEEEVARAEEDQELEYNDGGWDCNQGYARGRVEEEDMVFVAAGGEDMMELMLIHRKTR